MIHNTGSLSDTELFAWLKENKYTLSSDINIPTVNGTVGKITSGWRLYDDPKSVMRETPQEAIRDAIIRQRDQEYGKAWEWFRGQRNVSVVSDSAGFLVEWVTENGQRYGGKGATLDKATYNLWEKTNEIKSEI